jgi:hypothetical protein
VIHTRLGVLEEGAALDSVFAAAVGFSDPEGTRTARALKTTVATSR